MQTSSFGIQDNHLFSLSRLAFGISRERAAQYERMVYEQYKRKTREKVGGQSSSHFVILPVVGQPKYGVF